MPVKTRLHSSRRHTAGVLTVSPSMLCTGGVYLVLGGGVYLVWGVYLVLEGDVPGPGGVYLVLGGVPAPRGCTWAGSVCSHGGCTWSWGGVPGPRGCQVLPLVNRMTNRCKNITLPQTSFAGGKKEKTKLTNHQNSRNTLGLASKKIQNKKVMGGGFRPDPPEFPLWMLVWT